MWHQYKIKLTKAVFVCISANHFWFGCINPQFTWKMWKHSNNTHDSDADSLLSCWTLLLSLSDMCSRPSSNSLDRSHCKSPLYCISCLQTGIHLSQRLYLVPVMYPEVFIQASWAPLPVVTLSWSKVATRHTAEWLGNVSERFSEPAHQHHG